LFPRNQSQWINSRYTEVVKGFRQHEPFQIFAAAMVTRHRGMKFSTWIELASVYDIDVIARPFNEETITCGVVGDFLQAIGVDSSRFRNTEIRRNESVGPFTVSVARCVLRAVSTSNNELKWLQAERCKKRLMKYLHDNGWADTGYCGLTTSLARDIERELQPDNDAFAERAWARPWAEVFAADLSEEFAPNDYEISPPRWTTRRRIRRAVREVRAMVQEILLDTALVIEAPWNDLDERTGWISRK